MKHTVTYLGYSPFILTKLSSSMGEVSIVHKEQYHIYFWPDSVSEGTGKAKGLTALETRAFNIHSRLTNGRNGTGPKRLL